MTNEKRANYGQYAVLEGSYDGDLVDVLTNLMHYAKRESIDFPSAIETAFSHFVIEREEERDEPNQAD